MTLNSSQEECDYNTCTTGQKRNNILSTSNQTGIHQYNNRAIYTGENKTRLTQDANCSF